MGQVVSNEVGSKLRLHVLERFGNGDRLSFKLIEKTSPRAIAHVTADQLLLPHPIRLVQLGDAMRTRRRIADVWAVLDEEASDIRTALNGAEPSWLLQWPAGDPRTGYVRE